MIGPLAIHFAFPGDTSMTTPRITAPLLILTGIAAGLWVGRSHPAGAQAPGAPVTINAADHANLQAAFDADPDEGGVVRIPPGNYDITEPLVLAKPETRVEGSGAATHIHTRQ